MTGGLFELSVAVGSIHDADPVTRPGVMVMMKSDGQPLIMGGSMSGRLAVGKKRTHVYLF